MSFIVSPAAPVGSIILDFASIFAAQSAALTVFVKVNTRPTMGIKLKRSAATPKLESNEVM